MGVHEQRLTRRAALVLAAGACAGRIPAARAHDRIGLVDPPAVLPPLETLTLQGTVRRLDELLLGRVTALQLMFTGCSSTCPIGGALFADLQVRLSRAPREHRLLSLSIDPLGDDPASLRAWLRRFGAQAERWTGALTTPKDVDRLLDAMDGRRGGVERHTAQVYLFDTQARLCYRTAPMPPPVSVAELMGRIAQAGESRRS